MATVNDRPWLIKSGGRVLGPFTSEQVKERLLSRDLVVLDEIASPYKRWNYIRDEATFSKVVEELRIKNIQGKDDSITSTNPNENTATLTETMTASVTEALDQPFNDDLTEKLGQQEGYQNSQREVVIEQIVEETTFSRGSESRNQVKTYGSSQDKALDKKANKAARSLWTVTVLLLVGVVGVILYTRFISSPLRKEKQLNAWVDEAREWQGIGFYEKALALYEKAYSLGVKKFPSLVDLALLKVQVNGDTASARQMLTEIQTSSRDDRVKIEKVRGLSYLVEGDSQKAEEGFLRLKRSGPVDPSNDMNLASALLMGEKYEETVTLLKSLLETGASESAISLMLSEAYLGLAQEESQSEPIDLAIRQLGEHISRTDDYGQEARVLRAYISTSFGNHSLHESIVTQILDRDPHETNDFFHRLDIYRGHVDWPRISRWCLQLGRGTEVSARLTGLHAYCMIRAGDRDRAKRVIQDAVAQAPRDALLQGLYAYILNEVGLGDQASVALGRAIKMDRKKELQLPLILQARFCEEQNDQECALQSWLDVIKVEPSSLAAQAGIGLIHMNNRNFVEAKKYLEIGMLKSSNYKPFLKLRKMAEDEGIYASSQ